MSPRTVPQHAIVEKKSVSFREYCSAYPVLHIADYESSWKEQCWYSSNDVKEVRSALKATLFKMESGEPMSDDTDCTIGLESYTSEGLAMKRQNRLTAQNAVFFEQGYQIEKGTWDSEELADAYFEQTYKCQDEAHKRGLRYEQEASAGTRWAGTVTTFLPTLDTKKQLMGGFHRHLHQDLRIHKVNSTAA